MEGKRSPGLPCLSRQLPFVLNGGVLRGSSVITLRPDESVPWLQVGDRIRLAREQFERLASAFFDELDGRLV